MSAIEISIPASKIAFIRWLRRYVASTRGENFPTSKGAIVVSKVAILRAGDLWPFATIDGTETITDEVLAAMAPASLLLADTLYNDHKKQVSGLVNLWLEQKGKRLTVRLICTNSDLAHFFEMLIAAIRDQWSKKPRQDSANSSQPGKPDIVTVTETPESLQRPTGRPANADDEWAWCEVRLKGRSPKEVLPEWLHRIGPRADMLADPQDSFRKVIKPNRLAGKYGKAGESGVEEARK